MLGSFDPRAYRRSIYVKPYGWLRTARTRVRIPRVFRVLHMLTGLARVRPPRRQGYDLDALRDADYSAEELNQAGYSAQELKEAGTSLVQLKVAGTPMAKLKQAGYSTLRLKTQQRQDELRAQGVDLKKKQPRTRRERQRAREKRERQDTARAENRARLMARSEGARAAMRHLDAHLRGRILDYLDFDEILNATATDRAARAALPCVQEVHGITPRGLSYSCVGIVSQLTRCRRLTVCCASSAEDLRALSWPLHIMKDLRAFTMDFSFNADLTSFPTECDRLVRSGALRQLKDLADLTLGTYDVVVEELQPLDVSCVGCAAFKSLLSQLPLDCALQAAVNGLVPAAWVSEF